jgi:hypothetical protein
MFEVLTRFIERECSPGHVDWYSESAHKIIVDGEERFVRDEMQELYDWWHGWYHDESLKDEKVLWDLVGRHAPLSWLHNGEWNPQYASEEDRRAHDEGMDLIQDYHDTKEAELLKRMHRLVNLMPYLWT